ncbi:APA family basic amino acid/polyamine antiporter [Amycolatopsis echigonensis]|uniref:APA family basic amino acid/polyamine antiporter n=1 Tax=Amycolatopsis echigonensis TaxID=2576905 RepID=A0A2N3X1M9_9PSEU|nr:APC family permease [Amycolatopsis niigatensis]PKW00031.1 APA family basic amino acid/polyamine antiporter [Amycolatopsis niigatensis]
MTDLTEHREVQLRRDAIGLGGALAGTLANMAPVEGIFIVVVLVAAAMGTFTPWAFLLGALGILLTGWNVAQLARRVPTAGSYVAFAYHGAGSIARGLSRPAAAFTFYLSIMSGPVTIAAVVVFLGSWVQTALGLPNFWWPVFALLAVALTLPVVLRGAAASVRTSLLLFLLEAVGLALVSAVILVRSHSSLGAPLHARGGQPGGWAGLIGITFATSVSGFIGWENAAAMADEIKRPRRVVPIAILSSIVVVALLYVLATWATVSGYADWLGPVKGMARLGDLTNAAPYVELADHYAPWLTWLVYLIGFLSPAACYLAAITSCSRWTFASARAGLLPRPLAKVSPRSQVPAAAVWLWTAAVTALIVVPYFLADGNAVTVSAYEAGIGTVPLLLVYLLTSLYTPFYVRKHDRGEFSVVKHVLPAVLAVALVGYGVYEFVLPAQPPPANRFWIYIGLIFVAAIAFAAVAVRRGGRRLDVLAATAPDENPAPAAA